LPPFILALFASFVVAIKVYNALVDNPNTEFPESFQQSSLPVCQQLFPAILLPPAPRILHSSGADLFGVKFSKTISKL